jgi:hypothetical protein
MTLIKSMLLGSAAAIVAVAAAQAADLPTRKAAPVQYVQICNVGGIVGWVLPGSDTCVKMSGYITAQVIGGNLNTEYNWGPLTALAGVPTVTGAPGIPTAVTSAIAPGSPFFTDTTRTQRVLIAASTPQGNTDFYRHTTGYTVRFNLGLDFASNTAYGPLIGHGEVQGDLSNGIEPLIGNGTNDYYINQAYLTWAGITAGKAASFYSFTGGGDNFANFFSPDQKGFNEPILFAYTASFGGGFSATAAAQSPGSNGFSGGGTRVSSNYLFESNVGNFAFGPGNITYGGIQWPDFVGNLHVKQGWGEAQVSGVIHNVNVADTVYSTEAVGAPGCGIAGNLPCDARESHVGWGVDAGVKFNLTSAWGSWWGPGDDILFTGSYTQSAVWYSGLPDGMWGENGQVDGNGQPMFISDAYFNPFTNRWSQPTAWSVSGLLEHHFTPQFYLDLEGSIGGIEWNNMGGGCNLAIGLAACSVVQAANGALSPRALTWIGGFDLGWNPVTNLNFDLEFMYQGVTQDRPSGFIGTIYNFGQANEFLAPGDWKGNSNGFEGRLRITRYF